jgi:hypothetical protein
MFSKSHRLCGRCCDATGPRASLGICPILVSGIALDCLGNYPIRLRCSHTPRWLDAVGSARSHVAALEKETFEEASAILRDPPRVLTGSYEQPRTLGPREALSSRHRPPWPWSSTTAAPWGAAASTHRREANFANSPVYPLSTNRKNTKEIPRRILRIPLCTPSGQIEKYDESQLFVITQPMRAMTQSRDLPYSAQMQPHTPRRECCGRRSRDLERPRTSVLTCIPQTC